MAQKSAESSLPTWDQLKLFVRVGRILADRTTPIKDRSRRALAKQFNLSHSVVSNCIYAFKKHFGAAVVNNDGELTRTGDVAYRWASRVLELYERGARLPLVLPDEVHLGVAGMAQMFLLPGVTQAFMVELEEAGISVCFHEDTSERLLHLLRAEAVDAAICSVPVFGNWEGLEQEVLLDNIPTVVIASSKHPKWGTRTWRKRNGLVELSELAAETLCVLTADLNGPLAALPGPQAGVNRIFTERFFTIVANTQIGTCLGLVPLVNDAQRNLAQEQNLLVYDIQPATEIKPRRVALWLRKHEVPSPRLEIFLRHLRKVLSHR